MIEMMVTLSVVVAVTGVAISATSSRMHHHRVSDIRSQLHADLRMARMQAASTKTDVQLTFSNTDQEYSFWVDTNANGIEEADEVTVTTLESDTDVTLWAYPSEGTFRPNGTYVTSYHYTHIMVYNPEMGEYQYIHVFPSGEINLYN